MTESENLEFQRQGATARAAGRSEFDNPFLKSEAMPRTTGETPDVWEAKYLAWKLGWNAENLMR